MPIDASIPLRAVAPRIEQQDPIEQYSKGLQLKALLSQQQQQERGLADEQAQRQAFQQAGGDQAAYLKALAAGGNYRAYQAAQENAAKVAHLGAQTNQANAAAGKSNSETAKNEILMHRDQLAGVNDPQSAAQWIQAGYNNPTIGKTLQQTMPLEAAIARIPKDPVLFQQWKQQAAMGATKFAEQQESIRHNKATEGLTARGQNMVDARSRESTAATVGKPFEVTGPDGQPVLVTQDKQGNIKPVQGYSPKASTGTSSNKVNDAKDVLGILDEVDKILPSSTGSYFGKAIDEGARAVGASTNGAQASAKLKALQGALVSKMPKMSGPQSDKDVQLYREMAGQIGDDTLPVETRKAAAEEVRKLNKKYAGIPESVAPAKTKAGASVSNW